MCAQTPKQRVNPARLSSEIVAQQNTRVISLLEQLADQARASENLAFAVRAQSQAAGLLWAQDAELARSIFRRAFESLAADSKPRENAESAAASKTPTSGSALTAAVKRQLRSELLNQIAARDPELAEELARSFVEASKTGCTDSSSADCNSNAASAPAPAGRVGPLTREDVERRELLVSAALQVVERDPQQAMAFGQMSVALGISPNLARLLTLMRTVDAERADLLFSNAVARLEHCALVDFTDVHTLGTFVVSTVNSSAKQPLSKPLVMRFLKFASDQIEQRVTTWPPGSGSRDESSALYFIGRQLTELFSRYQPERLDQLQRYISDQSDAGSYDEVIDPGTLRVSAPGDIAREAREATDGAQRDELYARAALAWLAQGEVSEAQAVALRISGSDVRDRALIQIVRRHSSEKRLEDAVALARRIGDEPSRVELLVMLAVSARATQNITRAIDLLNEAETASVKARPSIDRARSLIRIAYSFSAFDTVRSFEVLQSAIKAINEVIKQQEQSRDESATAMRNKTAQTFTLDDLYAASFETTLAALAKADFDRALFLAQQLAGEEASVIAQLAVCRGGLVERRPSERSASDDEVESGINH